MAQAKPVESNSRSNRFVQNVNKSCHLFISSVDTCKAMGNIIPVYDDSLLLVYSAKILKEVLKESKKKKDNCRWWQTETQQTHSSQRLINLTKYANDLQLNGKVMTSLQSPTIGSCKMVVDDVIIQHNCQDNTEKRRNW